MIGETNNSGPGRGILCPIFSPLVKSTYSKLFPYFSTKAYVVGAQKNRSHGTVLFSTQNMLKLVGKKKSYNFTLKIVYLLYLLIHDTSTKYF